MYRSIVMIPLVGATRAGRCSRLLGERGAVRVSTGSVMLTFRISCIAFFEVGRSNNVVHVEVMSLMESGSFNLHLALLFDSLTVTMLCVVTLVSSLVHMYSVEYMGADPHRPRFHVISITIYLFHVGTSNSR